MHPFDGGFHYKTVVIPVRIRHGRVVTLDGQRLPDSLEDVPGRLIVPAFYFREEKQFAYLQAEGEGVFVPAGSVILMGITTPSPDREKRDPHVMPLSRRARDYLVYVREKYADVQRAGELGLWLHHVEIVPLEDLILYFRGTKRACLRKCVCRIPFLEEELSSLNQAATAVSEFFERARHSHTVNVFRRCYCRRKHDGRWENLELRRDVMEEGFVNQIHEEQEKFEKQSCQGTLFDLVKNGSRRSGN